MIKKQFEYIAVGTASALVARLTHCKHVEQVVQTQIADNCFHLTVNTAAIKEDMRELMSFLKEFDNEYVEDTDTKVTFAQIENFGLDDHDPKKKRGPQWDIPKGAFDPKSEYLVTKL